MKNANALEIKKSAKNSMKINLILIGIFAVFMAVSLLTMNSGAAKAKQSYLSSYDESYNNTYSSTYNDYVADGYEAGYEKYHVKNEVNIYVGDIQECSSLEVLNVSDFDYAISYSSDNEEKIDSVFEVTMIGTYCVNMKLSEFIIDNKNKTVTVRVQRPELTDFISSYEMLYFEKNGNIIDSFDKGNYSEGEKFANNQIKKCTDLIKQRLKTNQENDRNAEEAAINTLTSIITRLNPEIPDLKVFIEFDDTILV